MLIAWVIARRVPWIIPVRSIVAIAGRWIVGYWPVVDAGCLICVRIATAVREVEVIPGRTTAFRTAAKLDVLDRRSGRRGSGHADLESEGHTGDGYKHFHVLPITASDQTIRL
jgi:hypothetical protein